MDNKSKNNQYFTFKYSQPSEYRFSLDSVFLARRIFEQYSSSQIEKLIALDLCAGCGIVGLDFIYHCKKEFGAVPKSMDFLEVQDVYMPHFEINRRQIALVNTDLQFICKNYEGLQSGILNKKYDLILCNPPYFFTHQGLLSPSVFKNRCRFYIDSDFKSLLKGISSCLAINGQAYMLLRDLPEHNWNSLAEATKVLEDKMTINIIGDIRGTHFVKFCHNR